jgi:WD40 repeat protein
MPRLFLAVAVALALVAGQVRAQQQSVTAKSPDGKRIAEANGKAIEIKDAQTNKVLIKVLAHTVDVTALAYAPDGKVLASADKDGKVNFIDIATGRLTRTLKANASVSKLAFSPDGKKIEADAPTGKRTFEVATGKEIK